MCNEYRRLVIPDCTTNITLSEHQRKYRSIEGAAENFGMPIHSPGEFKGSPGKSYSINSQQYLPHTKLYANEAAQNFA
jgi:hypothetical protein